MNLYSYGFLSHNYDKINYLFLIITLIFGVLLIFLGYKYIRNRTNLKFRDFFILASFVVLLLIGIQLSNINNKSFSHGQQTATLLREISRDKDVNVNNIYTDSTNVASGMTVKVNDKFYTVDFNSNQTGYRLSPIKAIEPKKINYIIKNDFSLNIFHNEYIILGLKLLVGFIMLVVQINLSGKSNLTQSTVIDQMQNYVLGGIIGGMIYNPSITLLQFMIILLLWSIIIFTGRVLSSNTEIFKRILIGRPNTVIKNGHINVDTVLKSGMTADDLLFNLRSNGVEDYSSVKNAIFERNGSLTIKSPEAAKTHSVIVDGHVIDKELKRSGISYEDLSNNLIRAGKRFSFDQVFLAQVTSGKLKFSLYPQLSSHQLKRWLSKKFPNFLKNDGN